MIQIEPDQAPFTEEVLRDLQNMMIQHVNDKNIALETLPTSNVRISYYKRYDEHHLWRWLGVKNYNEGDPKPTVVVGSDDTGIFMTNLRNEYAHIYQTLSKSKNQQVALDAVEQLNRNSKAFTFRL
jgi:adenosine deaminase